MEAGSSSTVPPPPPPLPVLPSHASYTDPEQEEQLLLLNESIERFIKVAKSMGIDPEMALTIRLSADEGYSFVHKCLNEESCCPVSNPNYQSPLESSDELSSDNNDEAETTRLRYLYVSDGCEICLLDFKKSMEKPLSNAASCDRVPPLPIIATLNLVEKGHPVFGSLLKLGSDIYIIGGQEYSDDIRVRGYKGTSKDSLLLSFNPGGGRKDPLSFRLLPGGVIGQMKLPKVYPIVEEIDGAIHVFDSNLGEGGLLTPSSDWIFSHEVLGRYGDHNDSIWKWRKMRAYEGPVKDFMHAHVVVGPRIYALWGQKAVFFNSNEKLKWEVLNPNIHECPSFGVRTACDILYLGGAARCILEIGEEVDSRVYVIISLVRKDSVGPGDYYDYRTIAVAYLVDSSGKIIGKQQLHRFFKGGPRRLQPVCMKQGVVIRGDVEGNIGVMYCSLVEADAENVPGAYLFINTFSVEKIASVDYSKRRPHTEEFEFVRVDVKERYIYEKDEYYDRPLQACFMPATTDHLIADEFNLPQ